MATQKPSLSPGPQADQLYTSLWLMEQLAREWVRRAPTETDLCRLLGGCRTALGCGPSGALRSWLEGLEMVLVRGGFGWMCQERERLLPVLEWQRLAVDRELRRREAAVAQQPTGGTAA